VLADFCNAPSVRL